MYYLSAGNLFEEVCEACHITVNKSAVYGDSSAWQPGGIRLGMLFQPGT
jgi:glycine hydroxymethyltransferase